MHPLSANAGSNMVPVVQLVRASDCGSECRRFESVRAPTPKQKQGCRALLLFYVHPTKTTGQLSAYAALQKRNVLRDNDDIIQVIDTELTTTHNLTRDSFHLLYTYFTSLRTNVLSMEARSSISPSLLRTNS